MSKTLKKEDWFEFKNVSKDIPETTNSYKNVTLRYKKITNPLIKSIMDKLFFVGDCRTKDGVEYTGARFNPDLSQKNKLERLEDNEVQFLHDLLYKKGLELQGEVKVTHTPTVKLKD